MMMGAFSLLPGILSTDAYSQSSFGVELKGQINPACTGTQTTKFADIYADGNIAVQGTYSCKGALIYNIADSEHPTLAAHYNPTPSQQFLEAIVIGNRGYFGSGSGGAGVHIVDLTNPSSPVFLGMVNSANGGGYNTIHEMMVFDQNGQRFLIENSNGTETPLRIINITNPAAPVFVRSITPPNPRWVHAMHIRGNRMFTSGWGSGTSATSRGRVEIFDISNIATQAPVIIGAIDDPSGTGGNGNALHSTWSSEDGNYLYSCREIGSSDAASPGDVRVYDIRNPAVPLLVKKVSMAQLGIVATTPHNPVVKGNRLYVSWYEAGLIVFDITDPVDPKMIGQYDTWPAAIAPLTEKEKRILNNADPRDVMCGGIMSARGKLISGMNGLWAVFPFLGENKILIGDLATGLYVLDVSKKNKVSDFDGDGRTDISKFSPTTHTWQIEKSSNGTVSSTEFGLAGDKLASGDYDDDGKADIGVWRASNGTFYSLNSSNGAFVANQWGMDGDHPMPGDFDGDGKTDLAVWRPSNGAWYMLQSTAGIKITLWGLNGDRPLLGDYDGDGKDDLTIYRDGVWFILKSSDSSWICGSFGLASDRPVVGDFDGDGKADMAIYRPGTGGWYIFQSTTNQFTFNTFGLPTDQPIPADYDGDGKADIAIYRPGDGNWHILRTTAGYMAKAFGSGDDIPSPSSIIPQ